MIFVTVGSQKFPFNRLLEEIDRLVLSGDVKGEVFAQIGYSTYTPKYYRYKTFLNSNEFAEMISKSTIIITHGGTGSIIRGVKEEKKVIAVPRLAKHGEHVDNHQCEIIKQFSDSEMIFGVSSINEIEGALKSVRSKEFRKYNSNTKNIIGILEQYINTVN